MMFSEKLLALDRSHKDKRNCSLVNPESTNSGLLLLNASEIQLFRFEKIVVIYFLNKVQQ
jgi:hypothetical protein